MTAEELAERLVEVDQRGRSNTHRLDALERDHQALNRLATAVEVMAAKQDGMGGSLERLAEKVETLEGKPAKRWEFVVEKSIYFIVAAVMGFFLARAGL